MPGSQCAARCVLPLGCIHVTHTPTGAQNVTSSPEHPGPSLICTPEATIPSGISPTAQCSLEAHLMDSCVYREFTLIYCWILLCCMDFPWLVSPFPDEGYPGSVQFESIRAQLPSTFLEFPVSGTFKFLSLGQQGASWS